MMVIAIGSIVNMALAVPEKMQKENISVRVLELPTLQPLDEELLRRAAQEMGGIVTLEEHSRRGGLGSAVAEALADMGSKASVRRLGLSGCAEGCGSRGWMRETTTVPERGICGRRCCHWCSE